jgi:predicted nucleic acid-binding protein
MPVYSLPTLSAGTLVFVDANILVYGINGRSMQCHDPIIFSSDEPLIRAAQIERQSFGLLTNDSMIVACMRQQGVTAIATSDSDFEQVSGISVFRPDDIP